MIKYVAINYYEVYCAHADGEDYIITSTTVSVAAEEISKTFTVNIINDNIIECDETFNLTLSVPAFTCGVIVNRKADTTAVIIKDNGTENCK